MKTSMLMCCNVWRSGWKALRDAFVNSVLEFDHSFVGIRKNSRHCPETLTTNFSASEEEQLLELASDDFLRIAFRQKTMI
jgi:hypothetical protein